MVVQQVLDYLLTFDLEISLIWKSNWSIMKVLFLLARYMPFADLILIFYRKEASLSQLSQKLSICSFSPIRIRP